MAPIQIPDVILFRPGRTLGPIRAIVLHEYNSGLSMLDIAMQYCPRRRPLNSPGCHTSFHFGVDNCTIHQYVPVADTSWGFGITPPSCPEPICPPDPCESCTGLTADQYQPDIDGNPPVLPAFVADADGTVNSQVVHVAVIGGLLPGINECCKFLDDPAAYTCLVSSLAQIFALTGLVPSATTLLVHCNELNCLDIDQLVLDILAFVPPAPFVGCECITDVDPGDGLTLSITDGAIIAGIELDPDPSNTLSLSPDGLLGTSTGAPGTEVDSAVAPGGAINVNTNTANRFLITTTAPGDNVNLTLPVAQPDLDIYVKNVGPEALTITALGGATIDGVAVITLAGTTAGTYPFGNNGGESVHLLWDSAGGDWYVL